MAKKFKFDVSGVEPGAGLNHAKPGMYKAKIKEINAKESKAGNEMLEIVLEVLPKKKGYAQVWYYVLVDGSQEGRLREFLEAVGVVKRGAKKAKGAFDPDELVGKTVQVQLKSDTDQDGEYRPRVGKVLGAEEEVDEDDDSDDDEDEDDEDTDDDSDDDSDDDDDDDDDDSDGDDSDDDDDDDDDELYTEEELDDLSNDDLKEILEEWEIELDGKFSAKKAKAAILEAQEEDDEDDDDDDEEDEDDAPDYSEWEINDLKAELKERGLPVKGKKAALVKRLEEDDASDEDPFEGDDE